MSVEYKEVLDRLGQIDVKIGVVETKVDSLHETNSFVKEELKNHSIQDHWVQGSILTVLLIILTKLFMK